MIKTNRIKKRILAGILSAVTVISVSAATISSASAAYVPSESSMSEGTAGGMAKTVFGFIGEKLLNAGGLKLANMAIEPLFKLMFDLDGDPSNQDVIDNVDMQAEEIKAKINEVLSEVQALSQTANQYHNEEMRQLQAIDSNISTMEFRKQTDKVAEDYANVIKRIEQNKDNFTCNGMGKLNHTTYKAYKEIISDPVCNISTLQADFDAMLSFLKGERSSNDHENGYEQLSTYLLNKVIAADKNEHSYTKTPDYHKVIKGINTEITSMEEHAILDFFAINVLNNMAKKVKEYEIDNNIITVNSDEAPFARYENTADEMLQSLSAMDGIFNKVIKDNQNKILNVAPYTLQTTNRNNYTAEKGCRSFIDAWSQGIDSMCDFTISSNGRLITVQADAKKGYKLDDNVKGINASGGFEVPEYKKVVLELGKDCDNGSTFDSSAKSDLNTFTVSNYGDLTLTYTVVKGGRHAVYVPDKTQDATVFFNRGTVYGTTSSAICIGSGAKNTDIVVIGQYNYDCAGGFEDKGTNTKKGHMIFPKMDPPEFDGWYT